MAVATPAMLPVPTRDAVDTIMAWNDETDFLPGVCFFSVMAVSMSLMCVNCTPFVRTVKYRPAPMSRNTRKYVYM